jgi:hypothetical protein
VSYIHQVTNPTSYAQGRSERSRRTTSAGAEPVPRKPDHPQEHLLLAKVRKNPTSAKPARRTWGNPRTNSDAKQAGVNPKDHTNPIPSGPPQTAPRYFRVAILSHLTRHNTPSKPTPTIFHMKQVAKTKVVNPTMGKIPQRGLAQLKRIQARHPPRRPYQPDVAKETGHRLTCRVRGQPSIAQTSHPNCPSVKSEVRSGWGSWNENRANFGHLENSAKVFYGGLPSARQLNASCARDEVQSGPPYPSGKPRRARRPSGNSPHSTRIHPESHGSFHWRPPSGQYPR